MLVFFGFGELFPPWLFCCVVCRALVPWPWEHGAGVDSCLCRSEYLKLNSLWILGHVVIWQDRFVDFFFSWATFLYLFHAVWNSCSQSVLERTAPRTGPSAKLALQRLWGGWNVARPASNYGWSCAILISLLDILCPQLCLPNILVTIRCNLLGYVSRLLAPPAKG